MIKLKNGYKVIADDTCYKLVRERTATKKILGINIPQRLQSVITVSLTKP